MLTHKYLRNKRIYAVIMKLYTLWLVLYVVYGVKITDAGRFRWRRGSAQACLYLTNIKVKNGHTWKNNHKDVIMFTLPAELVNWKVTMKFDYKIEKLQQWNLHQISASKNGRTFTFGPLTGWWNKRLEARSFSWEYIITYKGISSPKKHPKLIFFRLKGSMASRQARKFPCSTPKSFPTTETVVQSKVVNTPATARTSPFTTRALITTAKGDKDTYTFFEETASEGRKPQVTTLAVKKSNALSTESTIQRATKVIKTTAKKIVTKSTRACFLLKNIKVLSGHTWQNNHRDSITLTLPFALQNWMVVLKFDYRIEKLQQWNFHEISHSKDGKTFKLGPLNGWWNKQLDARFYRWEYIVTYKGDSLPKMHPDLVYFRLSGYSASKQVAKFSCVTSKSAKHQSKPLTTPATITTSKMTSSTDLTSTAAQPKTPSHFPKNFVNNTSQTTVGTSKSTAARVTVAATTTAATTTTATTTTATTTTATTTTATTATTAVTTTKQATTITTVKFTYKSAKCKSSKYDYGEVLHKSLLFYEAQRSGALPVTNRIPWRHSSTLYDGKANKVDLTGGYFDSGGSLKMGFPMAFTLTLLSWGMIDYRKGYRIAGEVENALEAIKWGTDYLVKCHTKDYEFYGQVGAWSIDHNYGGRVEDFSGLRPAFKINETNPGTDLAGEAAAALAAGSIVFKTTNITYSQILLSHAIQLFRFGAKYRGRYSESIPEAQCCYKSKDDGFDELAWAAVWLYRATNRRRYLNIARLFYKRSFTRLSSEFSWSNKIPGVQILLAKLAKESIYANHVQDYTYYIRNLVKKSPKGLLYLNGIGSNRYAANIALLCIAAADLGISPTENREFAQRQIDYMLGGCGRSYVVGFGNDAPERPQHKNSACSPPFKTACNWKTFTARSKNFYTLTGALVAGPLADDSFVGDRKHRVQNAVALDYNAGFQTTVAAILASCDVEE